MRDLPKMSVTQLAYVEEFADRIAGFACAFCIPVREKSEAKLIDAKVRGDELSKECPTLGLVGGENQKDVAVKMAAYFDGLAKFLRDHLPDYDK